MFAAVPDNTITVTPDGLDLLISWAPSAPNGTWYQLYLDRQLAWWGKATSVSIPYPSARGPTVLIDVGTVAAGEQTTDFSAQLASAPVPPDKAELSWLGGTWEATDIAGFHVYASASPGAVVGYNAGGYGNGGYGGGTATSVSATPLATVPAYTAGQITDGWGFGGYGLGGYGEASGVYEWTSGHLTPGAWTFAVAAFDQVGNEDPAPPTTVVIILGPPLPPAPNAARLRLTYTYNATSHVATLNWLASPGY